MRCDSPPHACEHVFGGFQSLSGFLMRCDSLGEEKSARITWFQSLSGFLMRCDGLAPGAVEPSVGRFNPYRVF
ncbi:MAG: hypothetical protein PWR21_76 [Methanoculleus sp.]|nr:hypothetical protein [Methanoculleus sp.]